MMPNYNFIGKACLPRGFSFPLKRSEFDAFLDEHGITTVTGVAYCGPSDDARVLSADFHGLRGQGMNHTLMLWINAVPSALRKEIAAQLKATIFEQLAPWLKQFGDSTQLVSQIDHRFEVYFNIRDDGVLDLPISIDEPRRVPRHPKFRKKVRR